MNSPAYLVRWNPFQGPPDGIVCRIVEFPGWDANWVLAGVCPPFEPSEPVEFDTNFALLEKVPDYPNNTARWPVMSRRMLDVLLSVGEFAYHAIPVTLVQDTIDVDVRYDALGRPKPEYSKTDYVAVQLLSYTDVFDAERSLFTRSRLDPDEILRIRKLALNVPPEGLPPLFRLEVYDVHLFVSAEARAALDSAGIRGPEYVPLDKISP
jgi:hypothetical protein